MKNTLSILILILISTLSCKAQQIVDITTYDPNPRNNENIYYKDINNIFDAYLGTWEYQNGSTIFRIALTKITKNEYEHRNRPSMYKDNIEGHYEMIEVDNNGNETILYTSQKNYYLRTSQWSRVIFGSTYDGVKFGALIYDNSIVPVDNYFYIRGNLIMNILPNTTPSQATWKVTLPNGLYSPNEPRDFNIPTDIIMTKVN